MIVYRLAKAKYKIDLSGKGAEISGGRWNSKGTAIVYTSGSRALCTAEIAVHTPLGIIPDDYYLITIALPVKVTIQTILPEDLPANWSVFPPTIATQKVGDAFVTEQKALLLKVPSAIIQGDYNFLINPAHKDFKKIKITYTEPFTFNERLFKK